MKRKLYLILMCLIFRNVCFADGVSLYIHNQAYTKPIMIYKNTVYALVQDILPVLNLKVISGGRVLCAVSSTSSEQGCPQDVSRAFLFINGKPVERGVLNRSGKLWISLPALASANGYVYRYNPQTGIADLSIPTVYATSSTNASEQTDKGKTSNKDDKTSKADPLTAEVTGQNQDPHTNETRVSFSVKNISEKPVKGITATLQYMDGYGKILLERAFPVGVLAPGESSSKDDYWINPTGIYPVQTKVDLDWEGKKKKD